MRQIKFRGLYKNTWVYGSLVQVTIGDKQTTQIENADFDDHRVYEVDPKTVGQFTGVKDKAQKEIYEGDFEINNGFTWIVKYVGTSFVLVDKSGQRIAALDADTFTFVSGNIHETL